jgi:hypothetical protein
MVQQKKNLIQNQHLKVIEVHCPHCDNVVLLSFKYHTGLTGILFCDRCFQVITKSVEDLFKKSGGNECQ